MLFHIGPYIKCLFKMVDIAREKRSCSNANCPKNGFVSAGKYCSECGSKIVPVNLTEKCSSVCVHDIVEQCDERLIEFDFFNAKLQRCHIYVSNIVDDKTRRSQDSFDGILDLNPTQEMMDDELEEFKHMFQEEIALITDAYGKENVEICWGFFLED